jgi:sulfonate transport system ATP-binding protein
MGSVMTVRASANPVHVQAPPDRAATTPPAVRAINAAEAPGSLAKAAAEVRVSGLGKAFGSHQVLTGIDLAIKPGQVLAVLGASGSGKSTLLRAVAGLDPASSGVVTIDGRQVTAIDPRCAVAFQEPRLLPWRDLRGNVAIGLPRGLARSEGSRKVERLLDLVGLAAFAAHRPRQVSGGMAQRASLARALARDPGILLLDEPFGALDALTRLKMQDLLLDVLASAPTTVLLVTHDVDEALYLADHVIVLGEAGGQGGGAGVVHTLAVEEARPRDRTSPGLVPLRADLLTCLGVDVHH